MDKINTEAALEEAILVSEMKKTNEKKLLQEEFQSTYEKFKPANIVKNIFNETAASPGLRHNLIDKTVGVALVLLTNIILRKTHNSIVKRTIGIALVLGIKSIVSRNPAIVKKAGNKILSIISNITTKTNRNREYTYNSQI